MTYQEALTALQGLLGTEVRIAVGPRNPYEQPTFVAILDGELRHAEEGRLPLPGPMTVAPEAIHGETLKFAVGESVFYLTEKQFHEATWIEDEVGPVLMLFLGNFRFMVWQMG